MMRLFKLVAPLFVLFASAGCAAPDVSERDDLSWDFPPNIVWLVVEDLSPVIPAFGDSTITTPTLDRLAAEGVRYPNVFSPSGVCAPSRAAIATGMYPAHIGAHHMRTGPWYARDPLPEVFENAARFMPPGVSPYEAVPPPEVKMHSEYLRMAGYYTSNRSKTDYQFRHPLTAWDDSSPSAHWRNRKHGQPFFAIFNFSVTHESQIWSKAEDSLWIADDLDVPVPPYLPDNQVGQRDVRRMYSNIREMDYEVGLVLAELEQDGLLDSTIVFWYSDHGGPLPRQKRLLYDSGLRVPMIIRFPGAALSGTADDQLISFVDFMPTLLSLADIEPPPHVDGRAFVGAYAADSKRRYIHAAADRFDEQYDMIRAVRDGRYKYLRNYRPEQGYYLPVAYREQMPVMQELLRLRDSGQLDSYQAQWFRPTKPTEELFDTDIDPHELRNLATDPVYSEKLAELRAECDRWLAEINDKGFIPEVEFIDSIWPDLEQPRTSPPVAEVSGGHVTLRTPTEGASIAFQILEPAETPGDVWDVYVKPVPLSTRQILVAIAHRIGYRESEAVEVVAG
jgi:arylsulfatase A-like enzyme